MSKKLRVIVALIWAILLGTPAVLLILNGHADYLLIFPGIPLAFLALVIGIGVLLGLTAAASYPIEKGRE